MPTPSLLITTQGQVRTFTLNRPEKCNALNSELILSLQAAFVEAARDETVRLVILQGKGKHFCAGADIDWMQQLAQSSSVASHEDARSLASLLYQMYSFPKPILALAQGSTLGGGLGLLACADIVVGADNATFCFSEVKIGLVPAVISPYIVSILGEQRTRYYFLTAERFDAGEALRLGMVHRLVVPEKLSEVGLVCAKQVLANSPAALAEVKRLLPQVASTNISLELTEKTAEIFAKLRISAEAKEGLNAFIEKRPASWDKLR